MFNKLALDIQGRHFEGEHVFAFGVVTILAALALTKRYFAGSRCYVERNLEGKLAVITGGNTGIGKETARKMAKLGCTVIIGARDTRKNEETVNEIRKQFPHASITSERLDLGDKKSIVRFAEFVKEEAKKVGDGNHLDYLVNNAGVMAVLERRLTTDGMEMQIGINHFGHFYLTYQLWDLVKNSPAPRITNVSSLAHQQQGKTYGIDFNNIFYQNGGYNPGKAYTSSKIANILFTKELQKRMNEGKINGISMALHPGVVRTELVRNIT
jgi:retinol dehydrogenase-13